MLLPTRPYPQLWTQIGVDYNPDYIVASAHRYIYNARPTVNYEPNNITTLRLPKSQQKSFYTYEMSNPPTPILAPLLTPCIPSSSGLSTPTFGAGSQSGYDGETPHVLQRAIMQGEDVPESPIIDRDAGTDSPGVGHNQEGFAG